MTSFVVIGAGGLGSPLALALAAAGARRLVLVDDDVVDLSNLQRQIAYRTADVGRPKVAALADAVARRFPAVRVEPVRARFELETAAALVHDADVVCDGSDDLVTKFLTNDVCVAAGRRFVIAGAIGLRGQVYPVIPGVTACYRCLFEAPPDDPLDTCSTAGVLGATCGLVAALQAAAAWKLAGGVAEGITLVEDGAARTIAVRPRAGCCVALEAHA
jgi:adenylyltransferase/sulfurtransferase